MTPPRGESLRGDLVRAGVEDSTDALALVEVIQVMTKSELSGKEISDALSGAANPDQALIALRGVLESMSSQQLARFGSEVSAEPLALGRIMQIVGLSQGFADFLIRHPEVDVLLDTEALAEPPTGTLERVFGAIGVDPQSPLPIAPDNSENTLNALRVVYRRELMGIASRDLSGAFPMEVIAGWLSDLADVILQAALAIARSGVADPTCPLAIIAMGKTGGRELNYVSDVDVIFATDSQESIDAATALARGVIHACGATTSEGSIWEVDAALRPEGKQGALVRTVESHVGYYERWASTWEFQALLKARFVAGDQMVGEEYIHSIQPFIWSAADRDGFVSDVQAMRRRVEDNVDASVGERELKLGPGGLRDIEFSVQLLQLVHGRSDVLLRSSNTIDALRALATWGYVGRDEASKLESSYRFLRTLEHHLQLRQLRRTHTMPEAPDELRTLARSMGIKAEPVETLLKQWKAHATDVRRIHEKLFYRPLLNAVAGLDATDARLTTAAAADRLRALGFVDPDGALRNIEALTSGISRRAIIQRTLLPVMLSWFAQAPYPDVGLAGFRQVSDQVGSSHWYLRLLRDESLVAERLAHILASSKYLTDLIRRAPESISMLAHNDDLQPVDLSIELAAISKRHDEPIKVVNSIRAMRRRELFRIGAAAALGVSSVQDVGTALTELTDATIEGALAAVMPAEPLARVVVIAMGRYGGRELGFGSDADVMFIYEPLDGADPELAGKQAFKIINEMRALLSAPTDEPTVEIDADLRPEGKAGPLVRSLESTIAYYAKWSSPWEAQALLRARFAAGDEALGAAFIEMINPLRYPEQGLDQASLIEMRRLKARMEAERLPRGADPARHTKLGRGGLSDVEWVAQLLQLQGSGDHEQLRTTSTIEALVAEGELGLMSIADRDVLIRAWMLASEVRNALMLVRAKASDLIPADYVELSAVTYLMGYRSDKAGELEQDYLRATRRARAVMERIFYASE